MWTFLSLVLIAWTTQRWIGYWDRQTKAENAKLSIYLSWIPFLAECYACARASGSNTAIPTNYPAKRMEIIGTLQIIGPSSALGTFENFCELAESGFAKEVSFDPIKLDWAFSSLCEDFTRGIFGNDLMTDDWSQLTNPNQQLKPEPI